MYEIDIKAMTFKKCALCTYWFDPTCEAIKPVGMNIFGIHDPNMARKCMWTNTNKKAMDSCSHFSSKMSKYIK